MHKNDPETFCPASQREWRQWLRKNHQSKASVWLILYKKSSGKPSVEWSEAVDEALCFGWIDSTRKTIDDERFMQFFCKRKPNSVWSGINKEKVKRLMDKGLMTPAGLKSIETARQNGSWTLLNEAEELTVPKDLEEAFKVHRGAKAYFNGLSRSAKKSLLQWVILAKRPETRQKRIDEIAEAAWKRSKPKNFL